MRACRRCEGVYDDSGFRPRRNVCLECERAYDRQRYVQDTQRRRSYTEEWKKRNPKAQAEYNRRRRALRADSEYAMITAEQLTLRMSMFPACWICNKPIASDEMHYEHVKPLKEGGKHMLSNLRPAHAMCNLVKGSRWLGAARIEELRLSVVLRVNELMGEMYDDS